MTKHLKTRLTIILSCLLALTLCCALYVRYTPTVRADSATFTVIDGVNPSNFEANTAAVVTGYTFYTGNDTASHEEHFEEADHTLVTVWDGWDHWQKCTVCQNIIGEKEDHVINEDGKSCSGCDYVCFLSANISVSGFALDSLMSGLTASGTTDIDGVTLAYDGHSIKNADNKTIDFTSENDSSATFRPSTIYYATLYFDCGSTWPAIGLSEESFTLPQGFKFLRYYIDEKTRDDGSTYVQLEFIVMLPSFGGVSNEKQVTEMVIDIKNFDTQHFFKDVIISATCNDLPNGVEFTFKDVEFYYNGSSMVNFDSQIKSDRLPIIYVIAVAPDGFNFFGITNNDISVKNNLGIALISAIEFDYDPVYVSYGGKAISLSIAISSIVNEHDCDFNIAFPFEQDNLSPDITKKHTLLCNYCSDYKFENHVYESENSNTCSVCGYERVITLDKMLITVTGYEVDALIKGVSASYSGKYAGSTSEEGILVGACAIYNLEMMMPAFSATARFVPNETYYVMLSFYVPRLYDVSNCIYANVYVNGVKAEVFMGDASRYASDPWYELKYVLKLNPLKGATKQNKITNVNIPVSGFTVGGERKNANLVLPENLTGLSVDSLYVECNGKGMTDTDVFALGNSYVLFVEFNISDMYYGSGVTASDVKIGGFDCLSIAANDLGDGNQKRLLFCEYAIKLEAPQAHVHTAPTQNVKYYSDATYHYPLCGCGEHLTGVKHTFTEKTYFDKDTCSACGYVRSHSIKKITFNVSSLYAGMDLFDFFDAITVYLDDTEFELGNSSGSSCSMAFLGVYEGVCKDFNSVNQMSINRFDAYTDYTFTIVFMYLENFIDASALTKQSVVITGLGDTPITPSLMADASLLQTKMIGISFQLPKLQLEHIHGGEWLDEIPATATSNGIKAHYACTICKAYFDVDNQQIEDLVIPATGSACSHDNNEYGYCRLCQVKIAMATVTIGKDLTVTYSVSILDGNLLANISKIAMQFTVNEETVTVYASEVKNGYYTFAYGGIAPQQMSDLIDAKLVLIDGASEMVIAEKLGYSVKQNAQNLLNNSPSPELQRLLSDMLYYGAEAQIYRNYNLDNLATSGVVGLLAKSVVLSDGTDLVVSESQSDTAYFKSASVWFDNVNKLYVRIGGTADVSNLTVKVNGVTAEILDDVVYTQGIFATGFDQVYTFELYENGNLVHTVKYSVKSYVYAKQGDETAMQKLASALYTYGKSALNYAATFGN